jgi:two-component system nitrate/nitrite response regulator NarL
VPQAEGSYASRLSARQQSILGCLVQGDSNKAIARKMALAEATVKVHIKAILRKVRVRNRTQAAIWAKSNGSFITEDASLGLEKLSMELPFDVNIAHVESASHRNEANHIARSRTLRLVRNAD